MLENYYLVNVAAVNIPPDILTRRRAVPKTILKTVLQLCSLFHRRNLKRRSAVSIRICQREVETIRLFTANLPALD